MSTSHIRVGLAQTSPPIVLLNLNDTEMTRDNVKDKISNLVLVANVPRLTATALTAISFGLFGPQGRVAVPRVTMVITRGQSVSLEVPVQSAPVPDIKQAAALVASQGIDLISVGVGSGILDQDFIDELLYIATDETSLVQASFAQLETEGLPITLAEKLCEGKWIII